MRDEIASAAIAGSTLNANTGSAPSARVDSATAMPIDRNRKVLRRRTGSSCTRAPIGS